MTIRERFEKGFYNGHYELVDPEHPLALYIGKDDMGHYAIEYRGDFVASSIPSSTFIDVRQYGAGSESCLLIVLKDSVLLGIFSAFVEDLVESTRECIPSDGYDQIVLRYYLWKKMFQVKQENLTESEIMGLIGELLFLRDYMIPLHGEQIAIECWSGQDRTHKDFSIGSDWYEIKAVSSGKETVKISSIEQLQAETEGRLVVYQLEKMSPHFDGITLNKLAHELYHSLKSEMTKDALLIKFTKCGFDFSSRYDAFVYRLAELTKYRVSEGFPKLTNIELPAAVAKVQYDLILAELEPYKVDE